MHTSYSFLSISSLAVLLFFAACKPQSQLKPSPEGEARAAAKATQSALQMTLATDPQRVLEEKPFTVRIHVSDQAGKPVPDATVHGVLNMTTMDHGRQEFDLAGKGNGDYEASAKAAMEGSWELNVSAKRGADVAQQTFPLKVALK